MQKSKSLLVILPYPDDESFSMGGTLATYAANHTGTKRTRQIGWLH